MGKRLGQRETNVWREQGFHHTVSRHSFNIFEKVEASCLATDVTTTISLLLGTQTLDMACMV